MKGLLFFYLWAISYPLWASSSVMLFIDANDNPAEIKIAQEQAKNQGKKLIVYPQGKNQFNQTELETILAKNSFSSITFSGHSGGEYVYGSKGTVHFDAFVEALTAAGKSADVKSLYLLGCNTANKSKLLFWKKHLPGIEFIAGFDGTAPLGNNKAGLDYYRDILSKEESILKNKEEMVLKKKLESVKNITSFPTSVFISCDEDTYFYQPRSHVGDKFGRINLSECGKFKTMWENDISAKILPFIEGKKEATTANPAELKNLYEQMRQIEHCQGDEKWPEFDATRMIFLRFIKDFHQNYSKYYQKDLNEMIQFLKNINSKALEAEREQKLKFLNSLGSPFEVKTHAREARERVSNELASLAMKDLMLPIDCLFQGTACPDYVKSMEKKTKLHQAEKFWQEVYKNLDDGQTVQQVFSELKSDSVFSTRKIDEVIRKHKDGSFKNTLSTLELMIKNPGLVKRSDYIEAIYEARQTIESVGVDLRSRVALSELEWSYRKLSEEDYPYFWYDKTRAPSHPNFKIMSGRVNYQDQAYEEIWAEYTYP